ncbi:MAG TPA: hypothetical protein VEU30_05660 [Thermoanaerobaculia bacterium]|nr:hypothetical protein [Thermoanaerobaculia bacterium]
MTTTNTINGGSDLRLPSGYEVESATFHIPATREDHFSAGETSSRSGFRGRLDDVKSRGMSKVDDLRSRGRMKVHEVQHLIADSRKSLQTSIANAKVSMRDGMQRQVTSTQTSMRTSPMKWAGIAAGSGFALGMIGRYLHWRDYHRRGRTPDLVIIDATC